MATQYSELVIKAPFLYAKGLLRGFRYAKGDNFNFFFHRKSGIRRETMGEMMRELLEMEVYTYLCLPNEVAEEFIPMFEKSKPDLGARVFKVRKIKSAEFAFNFKIFTKRQAAAIRKQLDNLPEGVELVDFSEVEEQNKNAKQLGGYAPLQPYVYKGHGVVQGEFEGVINVFLEIKRSNLAENLICSDVKLHFE